MDPFAELARIADEIRRSIDGERFVVRIDDLRRQLDLAFAQVLDDEEDEIVRAEFLDGYRTLSLSLDELQRLHAA